MRNKLCFHKFILATSIAIYPSVHFAFFCPTNFSQITVGDTIEQVTKICGKPNKQETKEVKPEGPQEWSYYVSQTVSMGNLTPAQGTLKTQVTFDNTGKAINMSVNGVGVGATAICGTMIQLGDTMEKVKNACGEPSFINKQNANLPATQVPSTKVTTFFYNSTPPVKLIFKDGKLSERE